MGNLLICARTALRALRVNLLRTTLTMLGIIIGVGAVIATVSVGSGAQARVAEQIRGLGSNLIVISPGSASAGGVRMGRGSRPTITAEDAEAIAGEIATVQAVAPSVWATGGQVVYGNLNWWTAVQGTVPAFSEVREWPVVAGRFFTDDEADGGDKVALLGQTVTENLFGVTNPIGEIVRLGQVPFTIIGVLQRKGHNTRGEDQDDLVLIPLAAAKRRVIGPGGPRGDTVHAITVKMRDGADIKGAEAQMRDLLRQRHRLRSFQEDDFRIQNLTEVLRAEEEATRVHTILLAAIASVSLLVGGIGIMNIMLVSVTERTREIGIRLAVGATGRDILTQFLVEAVTLSLIGGVIGIALGVAASYAISYFAEWGTLVRPASIALAFAFAAAVGVFFGLYPARKAAALNPIDALRYE